MILKQILGYLKNNTYLYSMPLIYKITNIKNGKIYIGQTKYSVESRFSKHCSNSRSSKESYKRLYLYKSINKHGLDNFKVEPIVEGNFNKVMLDELEKHYIRLYNSTNPTKGYNSCPGGNSSTYIRTEEIKERISKKLIGNTCAKGIRKSESHKIKLKASMNNLYRNGYRMGACKYCTILDLNGNILKKYNTVTEAGKDLHIGRQLLYQISQGKISRKHKIKVIIEK